MVDRRKVEDDLPFKQPAKGIARDIVDRRAETAAGKYEIDAAHCFFDRASNGWNIVGDGGVAHELETNGGECRSEVLPVRV